MAPSLKEHSSFSLFLRPRHGNKKQASQTHQTFDPQNKKNYPGLAAYATRLKSRELNFQARESDSGRGLRVT